MTLSQQPPRAVAPTGSGGSRRGLAWASLILSLVFPLTYILVVTAVLVRKLALSGTNPFFASLYTVFDYFEWPFPILAVILGHIAFARGAPSRTVASVGIVLGYLSILALLGIVIALEAGAGQQHLAAPAVLR